MASLETTDGTPSASSIRSRAINASRRVGNPPTACDAPVRGMIATNRVGDDWTTGFDPAFLGMRPDRGYRVPNTRSAIERGRMG